MNFLCSFSLPDFLLEAEAMAVNWTSKIETSMSKGVHVRKSVTVGDKEETSWHPRVMGKVNWSWASEMGNEDLVEEEGSASRHMLLHVLYLP